jgi:hypothetical protein
MTLAKNSSKKAFWTFMDSPEIVERRFICRTPMRLVIGPFAPWYGCPLWTKIKLFCSAEIRFSPAVVLVFVSDHDEITMIIVVIVAFPPHNLCSVFQNQSLCSCKTSLYSCKASAFPPARYLIWYAKMKHCNTKTTFLA